MGLSPTLAGLSRPLGFFLMNHWPPPLSLATTRGISVDVFSFGYLDVSVPRVCLPTLCIQAGISLRRGFPIRISADQRLLASPRSFSQRATSFIASWRQGIHRTPLSRSHHTTTARTQDQTAHPTGTRLALRPSQECNTSLRSASLSQLKLQPIQIHLSKNKPPAREAPKGQAPTSGGFGSTSLPGGYTQEKTHHAATRLLRQCRSSLLAQRPASSPSGGFSRRQAARKMEATGFEPTTPCLQSRCSTN
jgi:hypothetical protein